MVLVALLEEERRKEAVEYWGRSISMLRFSGEEARLMEGTPGDGGSEKEPESGEEARAWRQEE